MNLDIHSSFDAQLSIVVPARNEANSIGAVIVELRRVFPTAELLIVDNGSDDGTADIARCVLGSDKQAKVIAETRPGKGNAMRAGVAACSRPVILFHDADTEYSAADARDVVLMHLNNADVGMVVGVRSWKLHRVPVVAFSANLLVRLLLKLRIGRTTEDVLSGTRCIRAAVFKAFETTSVGFAIETEITRLALEHELVIETCPVRYAPRSVKEGKKINLRHLPGIVRAVFQSRALCTHSPQIHAASTAKEAAVRGRV